MSSTPKEIGAAIRCAREDLALSQDQFARRARRYGLNWTTSRVSEIERGELRLSLSILICVSAALSSERAGYRVTLADLVGHEAVPITDTWSMSASELALLVEGRLEDLDALALSPDVDRQPVDELVAMATVIEPPPGMRTGITEPPAAPPEVTYGRPTLAEQRAAKRLGVEVRVVREWAHAIWGRSLEDEASARAASDTPQSRGHATRLLVSELERHLDGPASNTDW